MRVRITKKPEITSDHDRWSVDTGLKVVNQYNMYVTSEFWKDIQEFESFNFDYKGEVPEKFLEVMGNPEELSKFLETHKETEFAAYVVEMKRLLKKSGNHQLWQFNAWISPIEGKLNSDGHYEEDWIRSFSILGEKTLYKWDNLFAIQLPFMRLYCKVYNFYSSHWGPNKCYKKWMKAHYANNSQGGRPPRKTE